MADLTEVQAAQTIKLVGSSSTGAESNFIGNVEDRLKVEASLPQFDGTSGKVDAFGRLRVSSPATIFSMSFPFDLQTLYFSKLEVIGATVTHDLNKQAAILTTSTSINSRAVFQTKEYKKYEPGKSALFMATGNFKGGTASVIKSLGFFDDSNGLFFQMNGITPQVVIRTKTSGSVVDTAVSQASWNLDPMDGTGPSGVTIDFTKQQIFAIDFQWLGSGRVRFGFYFNGSLHYCHQFTHANSLSTIYTQYGNFPIRVEIKNDSTNSSTMEFTCCAYVSEDGFTPQGLLRSISNETTPRSFGTSGSVVPMLSIRRATNDEWAKIPIRIVDFGMFTESSDSFLVKIIYNGTLTGASWTSVSGFTEKDVSATDISGGTVLYSTYLTGGSSAPSIVSTNLFETSKVIGLGRDLSGVSDIYSVVATNITPTASAFAYLTYKELI